MIHFKDFTPQIVKKGGLFKSDEFETFDQTLKRFNDWSKQTPDIEIINIETVVLPNIHSSREEGSEDTDLGTYGDVPTQWHQFIRVWYKAGE